MKIWKCAIVFFKQCIGKYFPKNPVLYYCASSSILVKLFKALFLMFFCTLCRWRRTEPDERRCDWCSEQRLQDLRRRRMVDREVQRQGRCVPLQLCCPVRSWLQQSFLRGVEAFLSTSHLFLRTRGWRSHRGWWVWKGEEKNSWTPSC